MTTTAAACMPCATLDNAGEPLWRSLRPKRLWLTSTCGASLSILKGSTALGGPVPRCTPTRGANVVATAEAAQQQHMTWARDAAWLA